MGFFTKSPAERFGPDLLDRLPLGVSVYTLEDAGDPASLRLVYSNAASGTITGLDPRETVGQRIVEVVPGIVETGLLAVYADVVREQEPRDLGTVEYGDERIERSTYAVRAFPIGDRSVAVAFEDVADRAEVQALRDAQAHLEREEARYRSLVQAAADIVWTTPPSGELDADQSEWRAVTGQTVEESVGTGWLDAVHPDDRAETLRAWQHAVETRTEYRTEHRLRHADGSYRWMSVRGVPVLGADGEVVEWVGIHTDIEDEREAAERLAASESRFETLFDAVDDVVLVYPLGPDGPEPFVAFNAAAVDRYGYPADDLRQMAVTDLLDPDRVDVGNALDELRKTRRATFDSVHLTRDGRRLPMQTSARLVEYDGRLCVVAVCRDDSDRRQFRREIARANHELERAVAERTAQLEAFSEDLKILHGITTAEHGSPQARVEAYLQAGREMFEMPVAILSATPFDQATGQRLYRLEAVLSPDPALERGVTVPLTEAFCDAVVETGGTVVYADAREEAPGHPACVSRGLRAFIGTPVIVHGDTVGTLNFVSPEPREGGFSDAERDLVEVMAQAIGRHMEAERADAERQTTRERYRAIVETVDAGVIVVDRDLRVVMSNPSARALLGLDVAGGDDATDHMSQRWPVVDERGEPVGPEALPEREAIRSGEPVRGVIQGVRRPGGEVRWYRVNATPMDDDDDGLADSVVVSFHDVTDLRDQATVATRAGGLLQSVLTASPDGVMAFHSVRDDGGQIEDFEWVLVNPTATRLVGRAADELVGSRLLEVFPGNREAGLFDAYVGVVESGEPYETRVEYPHDGLDTAYRVTAAALPGQDGFAVTFAEVQDPAAVPGVDASRVSGAVLGVAATEA